MTESEENPSKRVSSYLLRKVLQIVSQSDSYKSARTNVANLLREHHYQDHIKDLRYQARVALEQRASREKI